jgi:hypothetical protein
METVIATTAEEPTPPTKSFLGRVAGIFISPGPTFADIARRPGFIAPVITLAVAASALFDTMYWKVGMETMTRLQLERSIFASRLTPEQMEKAVSDAAGHLTRTLLVTPVAITAGTIVFMLILAGLGMAIVNVIFGGDVKFKTLLSVAAYANLVTLLNGVLALPVVLFGGTDNLDPQNPTPVNIAFFLNYKEVSKPLFALAGSADIVVVWMVILLGVGMSRATGGRVKAMPITLCFVGLWAVWIIGKVAVAAIL